MSDLLQYDICYLRQLSIDTSLLRFVSRPFLDLVQAPLGNLFRLPASNCNTNRLLP